MSTALAIRDLHQFCHKYASRACKTGQPRIASSKRILIQTSGALNADHLHIDIEEQLLHCTLIVTDHERLCWAMHINWHTWTPNGPLQSHIHVLLTDRSCSLNCISVNEEEGAWCRAMRGWDSEGRAKQQCTGNGARLQSALSSLGTSTAGVAPTWRRIALASGRLYCQTVIFCCKCISMHVYCLPGSPCRKPHIYTCTHALLPSRRARASTLPL